MRFLGKVGIIGLLVGGLASTVAIAANNARINLYEGGTGGPCEGEDLTVGRGFVNFHRSGDNVIVNVHVREGVPGGAYDVFVRCRGGIGTLTTDASGNGDATFRAPWSPGFSIDMHELAGDYISSGPFPQG